MAKIFITDLDHVSIEVEKSVLDPSGIPYEWVQCRTEDAVIEKCQGATALMIQYAPITEKVIAALPELKIVVRYGVGVNNIDIDAATKHGVLVCNVPDYGFEEVANHTVALMYALTRKIVLMNNHTKTVGWDYSPSLPIYRYSEQTVGVVGVGRIGQAFAEKMHAIGFNVIATDDYAVKIGIPIPDYIKMVSIDELIKTSDIISVHCPLEFSKDLIGDAEFKQMKPNVFILNTSRGGIINEEALDRALEQKLIAGAGFDVMVKEPADLSHPLFRHENFLCTPHMAWYSEEASLELKRKTAEEAVNFTLGKPVRYALNKPVAK
ncbi:MAG: C-terminal binding protein [Christensenellales bacterium]